MASHDEAEEVQDTLEDIVVEIESVSLKLTKVLQSVTEQSGMVDSLVKELGTHAQYLEAWSAFTKAGMAALNTERRLAEEAAVRAAAAVEYDPVFGHVLGQQPQQPQL